MKITVSLNQYDEMTDTYHIDASSEHQTLEVVMNFAECIFSIQDLTAKHNDSLIPEYVWTTKLLARICEEISTSEEIPYFDSFDVEMP